MQIETIHGVICKPYVVDGNKLIERITELGRSDVIDSSVSRGNVLEDQYLIPTSYVTDEIMKSWAEHMKSVLVSRFQVLKQSSCPGIRTQSPFPRYLALRMMYFYMCVYLFGSPSDDQKCQIANFTKSYTEKTTDIAVPPDLLDLPSASFVDAHPWALLIQPSHPSRTRAKSGTDKLEIDVKHFVSEMPFIVICCAVSIMNLDDFLQYINNTDLYLTPFKNLPIVLQKMLVTKLRLYSKVFDRFEMLFLMKFVGLKNFDKKCYGKDAILQFIPNIVVKDTVCGRQIAKPNSGESNPDFGINEPLQYFEEIHYEISNLLDAIKFWDDLRNICVNTLLIRKEKSSENFVDKFKLFDYALEYASKNHTNICDNVQAIIFESDDRGVAGFDSRINIQLRRLWFSNPAVNGSGLSRKRQLSKDTSEIFDDNKNDSPQLSSIVKHSNPSNKTKQSKILKYKPFVEDPRPFSPNEDTLVFVVSLAIEIIGNKNFIMYYWKVAKNFLIQDPIINNLIERRSLKILHQRSETINAASTSLNFTKKVEYFRNYQNIPLILEEIKLFKNIDSNFEQLLSIIHEHYDNIVIEVTDTLPENITIVDVFNVNHNIVDYTTQPSEKYLNFELIPHQKKLNEIYKCQLVENISPFNEVSEACLLNLILKNSMYKFSSDEGLHYLNTIGQRKLINAVSRIGSSGIFQRQTKLGLHNLCSSVQDDTLLNSVFDLSPGLSYLKSIRVLKIKNLLDRNEKSSNALVRIRQNDPSIFNFAGNQSLIYEEIGKKKPCFLCQTHVHFHDISTLLRLMASGYVRLSLIPPSAFPKLYSNYSSQVEKSFYFSNFFSVDCYTYPDSSIMLSDLNLYKVQSSKHLFSNNKRSTLISQEDYSNLAFSVNHLSTNYDVSADCIYPRKFFYHVRIDHLPTLTMLKSEDVTDNQDDLPITISQFYYDYSKPLELDLNYYYPHLRHLVSNIFIDIDHDNKIPHDLTQFLFHLLLNAQSAGLSLEKVISETLDYFKPLNKALQPSHVSSLVQLLVACGLLIEIPLDFRHIVHANYANQWHITVEDDSSGELFTSSFISRPWIDHRTGTNCQKMCKYMLTLFKSLIYDKPGISKSEINEQVGKFLHTSVVEEILTLLECDLLVCRKRYPRKQTKIEIFGSPQETFNGFEDCYHVSNEFELAFVYPDPSHF